ncbi:MAG: hypothetical protein P4L46_06365 [Fimbriimonas sp.]|nr:hypothetical protein [Fimbriimonas sp.]
MEKAFTFNELQRPEDWSSVRSIYGDTVVFSPDLYDVWKGAHFMGMALTESNDDATGATPPRWVVRRFDFSEA